MSIMRTIILIFLTWVLSTHTQSQNNISDISSIAFGWLRGYEIRNNQINHWGSMATMNGSQSPTIQPSKFEFNNPKKISCGYMSNFIIDTAGKLYSWGYNRYGEAGLGSTNQIPNPSLIPSSKKWLCVLGNYATMFPNYGEAVLAIKEDSSLWGWGENKKRQVITGSAEEKFLIPVSIDSINKYTGIGFDKHNAYALRKDGTLWRWGNFSANNMVKIASNIKSVYGNSNVIYFIDSTGIMFYNKDSDENYAVFSAQIKWKKVSTGWDHCIGISTDNKIYTWGGNHRGQMGVGVQVIYSPSPMLLSNIEFPVDIATHEAVSMIKTANGLIYAFGNNGNRMLGLCNTNFLDHFQPAIVSTSNTMQLPEFKSVLYYMNDSLPVKTSVKPSTGYQIIWDNGVLSDTITIARKTPGRQILKFHQKEISTGCISRKDSLIVHIVQKPVLSFNSKDSLISLITDSVQIEKISWFNESSLIRTDSVSYGTETNFVGNVVDRNQYNLMEADRLHGPKTIMFDQDENFYVADGWNKRVQKFLPKSKAGSTIFSDESTVVAAVVNSEKDLVVATTTPKNRIYRSQYPNSSSSVREVGLYPSSLAIDKNNNVYYGMWNTSSVFKINYLSGQEVKVAGTGGFGNGLNQLSNAIESIFLDDSLQLYVSDFYNNRIMLFTGDKPDGKVVFSTGNPKGIAKKDNFLYVIGQGGSKLIKVNLSNGLAHNIANLNSGSQCNGITLNKNGDIFISKENGGEVVTFKRIKSPQNLKIANYGSYVALIEYSNGLKIFTDTLRGVCFPPSTPKVRDTSFCQNDNADSLKVTADPGHSILWYGNNASGGTSSSSPAKPNTSAPGSQTYYVSQVSTSSKCESSRIPLVVNIHAIPPSPSVSNISYCQSSTASSLIATAITGNSLIWFGTNATGGTGTGISPIPSTAIAGITEYFVSQINNQGCYSPRAKIVVNIKALPQTPSITKDAEGFLISSAGNATWYKDSIKLNDTSQRIKPLTAGNYSVTTTQNGCTSPMSLAYNYTITGIYSLLNGEYIKIYPNPTPGKIYLDYRLITIDKLYLTVFDKIGRIVDNDIEIKAGNSIDLRYLTKGHYFLVLKDKKQRLISKNIIIKE